MSRQFPRDSSLTLTQLTPAPPLITSCCTKYLLRTRICGHNTSTNPLELPLPAAPPPPSSGLHLFPPSLHFKAARFNITEIKSSLRSVSVERVMSCQHRQQECEDSVVTAEQHTSSRPQLEQAPPPCRCSGVHMASNSIDFFSSAAYITLLCLFKRTELFLFVTPPQ